jgi:hypothetical protein
MTTVLESGATTVCERVGHPYPETGVAPRSDLRCAPLVNLCAAYAVLGLCAYTILQDVAEITTDNAAISAYTAPLRTRIDVDVTHARVDDQRLVDLRADSTRLRAGAVTLAAQETVLAAALAVIAAQTGRNSV